MSGTRGGVGRIVAMGIGLAVALLLALAAEARAAQYAVAQCGWYVGADADWADTTGGAKFRHDGWCVPPAGADPFAGVHLKSLTRGGAATVSGTRFARWRWVAPAGTGITQVRGTWWHVLHDGFQQRLGVDTAAGGFDVFAAANATDTTPREFVAGFASADARLRGSPALRPRREQVVLAGSRLVVGPAGADDRPGGSVAAGGEPRRRHRLRRLAPRRAGPVGGVHRLRLRGALRRNSRRRSTDRTHRVPLRQGVDRRRVASDRDAALCHLRRRLAELGDDRPQRRPPRRHRLRRRLRRQPPLHPGADAAGRQQPAGSPRDGRSRRRRGLAADRRLRPQLGQPRPGSRPARSPAPPGA